jgi:hypothetical protein
VDEAYEDETDELAGFMAARVDEEEASAEAVLSAAELFGGVPQRSTPLGHQVFDGSGIVVTHDRTVVLPSDVATHIARHDPPRALASVAADRAMLHEHAAFAGIATHDPSVREWANALGRMVRIRASAWAWHPEYKPGWKP